MSERLHRLDIFRGITLISMILYHFVWDLNYIASIKMSWYRGTIGTIWQKSICISFIFISGFCFKLGKKHFKRSMTVFLSGILVSAATLIFMPDNRIVFGILTFAGTAGIIAIPFNKLMSRLYDRLDDFTVDLTMLIWNLLMFIAFYNVNNGIINLIYKKITLPAYVFDGYFMTFMGFPDPYFFSTDYFSLIPWIFLYFTGYFAYNMVGNTDKVRKYLIKTSKSVMASGVEYLGKNTLIAYLIHQPILYLITLIIMEVR